MARQLIKQSAVKSMGILPIALLAGFGGPLSTHDTPLSEALPLALPPLSINICCRPYRQVVGSSCRCRSVVVCRDDVVVWGVFFVCEIGPRLEVSSNG